MYRIVVKVDGKIEFTSEYEFKSVLEAKTMGNEIIRFMKGHVVFTIEKGVQNK